MAPLLLLKLLRVVSIFFARTSTYDAYDTVLWTPMDALCRNDTQPQLRSFRVTDCHAHAMQCKVYDALHHTEAESLVSLPAEQLWRTHELYFRSATFYQELYYLFMYLG